MGSDPGGNDSFFYIVQRRQTQMFRGSDITEEGRAACGSQRSANGRCNMIISGSYIGYNRSLYIEWGSVA